MIESFGDVVALACLALGAFLCLSAGVGLVRFPDVLARMHAGTKPQVLGVLLIMVGAAIRLQGWSATWMLLLVALFQLVTAPVSAHMISRVAYRRRHVRRDLLLVDELRSGESYDRFYEGDEPADAPPEDPSAAAAHWRDDLDAPSRPGPSPADPGRTADPGRPGTGR